MHSHIHPHFAAILNSIIAPSNIVTDYDPKPVPVRCWDWCATLVGYDAGDPIGWGATEQEAIEELKEQIKEQQ